MSLATFIVIIFVIIILAIVLIGLTPFLLPKIFAIRKQWEDAKRSKDVPVPVPMPIQTQLNTKEVIQNGNTRRTPNTNRNTRTRKTNPKR